MSNLYPPHRSHPPRPCLKTPVPSPVPSMNPSPCPTPFGAPMRGVHFPPQPALRTVHTTHGPEYDRSPIAPPSESERACALPARGCPGRSYDLYSIDRVGPPPSAAAAHLLRPEPPALSFSSSSEESDEWAPFYPGEEPAGAEEFYPPSYTSPAPAHTRDTSFLPHAPSKRRSISPARKVEPVGAADGQNQKETHRRVRGMGRNKAEWSEWSQEDDGGCLGGF